MNTTILQLVAIYNIQLHVSALYIGLHQGCPKNLLIDYTVCVVILVKGRDFFLHQILGLVEAEQNMSRGYTNCEHLAIPTCKLGSKTVVLRCSISCRLRGFCKTYDKLRMLWVRDIYCVFCANREVLRLMKHLSTTVLLPRFYVRITRFSQLV